MSRGDGLHQERNDNFLRPPAPRVTSVRSTNLTPLAPEEFITSGGPQTETRTLRKGKHRCGYAVMRPIHPPVPACHRAGVRAAKLSVISSLLLYLLQKTRQPASAGTGGEYGTVCQFRNLLPVQAFAFILLALRNSDTLDNYMFLFDGGEAKAGVLIGLKCISRMEVELLHGSKW
ncbi:hypothetical protein QQF64_003895 [Cirrhinus molitorella]|uniref:Uncharacterized protein n=1 Tax=Cirrhinus molitorella TaxID=172907 RepID=A0ABR3MML0_9TELE